MRIMNAVNVLDGNAYLIAGTNRIEAAAADFDDIYSRKSEDLSLDAIFNSIAQEYGVDVSLLKAVAQAESGFDTNAVSGCGAMGIMQLMPATAESLGVADPFDARQNITGGAKMLAYLLEDYNGNVTLALAAYNAGSGSVQKYGGVPPYSETLGYIEKINKILGGALEQDSRTVEGATATDLGGACDVQAPADAPVLGTVRFRSGGRPADVVPSGPLIGASGLVGPRVPAAGGVFSQEDYEDFKKTCKAVLQRFEAKDEETAPDGPDGFRPVVETDGISQLPPVFASGAAVQRKMVFSGISAVDNLMKNSPQSLYEAQASVISPMVAQIKET